MKVVHKAGDKLFVDYSGDGLEYINRQTGEVVRVELFVYCWGASSYCYAEATHGQRAEDFVASHARALAYFGCVPHAVVPDNLRSTVKKVDRYEPDLMSLYQKLAEHYGFAVLPTRVRKPRDKAPVESAVGNVHRYILARLRDQQFFSLFEVNAFVCVELDAINREPTGPPAQPIPLQPHPAPAARHWMARTDTSSGGRDKLLVLEQNLKAARALDAKLRQIGEGDGYRIQVPWKPEAEQPKGWDPDLDDGVKVNIGPFQDAGVLAVRKVV